MYYEPAYLKALQQRGEGIPLLVSHEEAQFAAAHVVLLRKLSDLPFPHPYQEHYDAISPYGYAGPILSKPEAAEDFWNSWQSLARERGIVAEFIRFHPLLENHLPFLGLLDVKEMGTTIWIDLQSDVWQGISKSRRRDIRFAQRQGVQVEKTGPDAVAAFTEMYRNTMKTKEATDYYFFDGSYFETLGEGLAENFWLMRAHVDQKDCSYALCLRHGDFLHYHLSCSDPSADETRSVNLLLFETARLAQQAGCHRFHLGGGYRGTDSLFQFKAKFSPLRSAFHIGRVIHDPEKVSHLTTLARENKAVAEKQDFFPPYRSSR